MTDRTALRRVVVLISSAALLASLTVAIPASAQGPTCDGRPATIVGSGFIPGTDGPDVIVGSDSDDVIFGGKGRDIICGGKGDDVIFGEEGRDRVFGGGGNDQMAGGPGHDDLFGWRGDDLIRGGGGNDFINGGSGVDNCAQGAGSGAIKRCERADLRVNVISPANAPEGTLTFKVKVKNLGPHATPYNYLLDLSNRHATCGGAPPWEKLHEFGKLRRGATRKRTYQATCAIEDPGSWVEVSAMILTVGAARDKRPANNSDTSRTNMQ